MAYHTNFAPDRSATGFAAGVLLLRGGSVILGQRGGGASHPFTWAPFGGKALRGESELECAVRETYEETAIDLDAHELVFIHERVERSGFRFVTFVTTVHDGTSVQPWNETHAVGEFPLDADPRRTWSALPAPLHPGFAALMRDHAATMTVAAMVDNVRAPSFA